jgi:hypothetical protein
MANRTAWTGGNLGPGLGWISAFNTADLNALATGASVLSSVAAFANGTALDQFCDISLKCAIASSAVAAGANMGVWLAMLQNDGTTLGDGLLTAGTQAAAWTPAWPPIASVPLYASTRTSLIGGQTGVLLPPGSFALILQNGSGFALAASGNTVSIRTYNVNLNN